MSASDLGSIGALKHHFEMTDQKNFTQIVHHQVHGVPHPNQRRHPLTNVLKN